MAVIGSTRAGFDKGCPAPTQLIEKAVVCRSVDPGDVRQLSNVGTPGRSIEVAQGVGPEGRKNALAQTVGGKLGVVAQVRRSRVRCRDDLDVEAVQQRPLTELRVRHASGDLVMNGVSRLGARDKIKPENFDELVFQPVARGRATEELPVLAERTPNLPRVRLDRAPIEPRHPELSGSTPWEESIRNT